MEIEKFVSGYCRQLDSSRTVCVVLEGSEITEIDCCYDTCPHRPACPMHRITPAPTRSASAAVTSAALPNTVGISSL